MKVSKNKDKIVDILKQVKIPVNVQYIYENLSKSSKVNLSTVYRCINSLCNERIILKEIRNDKNAYYTLNSNSHKHQLTCEICKDTVFIDECPVSIIAKEIKEKTGFNITNHSVQLNGICKKCNKENI